MAEPEQVIRILLELLEGYTDQAEEHIRENGYCPECYCRLQSHSRLPECECEKDMDEDDEEDKGGETDAKEDGDKDDEGEDAEEPTD